MCNAKALAFWNIKIIYIGEKKKRDGLNAIDKQEFSI